MSENVNIDLSGEINAEAEKKGFQKYVNDVELLMQHIRSGGGQALLMGFLASRRPWTQFVATEHFKAPASLPRLTRRVYRNVEYFQANYFMVFLGLFLYCLITSPLLLIVMVGSFFGYRKLTAGPNTWKPRVSVFCFVLCSMTFTPCTRIQLVKKAVCGNGKSDYRIIFICILEMRTYIGRYELTKTQQYAVAAAGSTAVCWFAGVGAVVFWVLGATVTIVALHAGLFDSEALPPAEDAEQFPMIEQV